jgi:DNA-binding NtrC family response regulator
MAVRILVVDDEPMVLGVVSKALSIRGYETHAVLSPTKALELATAATFDLVLSDVLMPEMCGPELVKRIAQICPTIAVLLMSGQIAAEALPMRAAFIGKPFLMKDLYSAVEKALRPNPAAPLADG